MSHVLCFSPTICSKRGARRRVRAVKRALPTIDARVAPLRRLDVFSRPQRRRRRRRRVHHLLRQQPAWIKLQRLRVLLQLSTHQ